MSDVKISELPDAGEITGDELLPLVQDNETKKTTVADIKAFADAEFVVVSGTYTGVVGDLIQANTGSSSFTITLPASPSIGDFLLIEDAQLTWNANNLTIARNGNLLNSGTSDYLANVQGGRLSVVFCGGSIGWSVKGVVKLATATETQAGTDPVSVVTPAGLASTWGVFKTVTGLERVTNSNTLTDSTSLQIPLLAGTYRIVSETIVASSAYATAGSKESLIFTGTATWSGLSKIGGASNATGNGASLAFSSTNSSVNGDKTSAANSLFIRREGVITVTVAGTLKIQFAQNSAISSQYTTLTVGSFLFAHLVQP